MAPRQYFNFRKINRRMHKQIYGVKIFKNTNINNVIDLVIYYRILQKNYGHTTLNRVFIKTTNALCETLKNNGVTDSNIELIKMLQSANVDALQEIWQQTF